MLFKQIAVILIHMKIQTPILLKVKVRTLVVIVKWMLARKI